MDAIAPAEEIVEGQVETTNKAQSTGQVANTSAVNHPGGEKVPSNDSRWTYATGYIRPPSVVRTKADYWVLDTSDMSKNPFPVLRKGNGPKNGPTAKADVPLSRPGRPGS